MPLIATLAALLAAGLHVLFFVLESVTFGQPRVAARFGLTTPEQIAAVRPMAYNQGFYNLFLALGIVGGLVLVASGSADAGRAIVLFACACMVGAGLVLISTNRRFIRDPGGPAAGRDRRGARPEVGVTAARRSRGDGRGDRSTGRRTRARQQVHRRGTMHTRHRTLTEEQRPVARFGTARHADRRAEFGGVLARPAGLEPTTFRSAT